MTDAAILTMRPEIRRRVQRFLLALESSGLAKHVLAVIVAGSACRGEEVWRDGQLISDIDLMLVTKRTNPYRTRTLSAVMDPFRIDGIDGGPTPLPSLQKYRTFTFYEAGTHGVVVWGDRDLDKLLPPMTSSDLPRWEAIRVLANRMFEHLKMQCGRTTPDQATAKSYEALAEAALALEGRYRASYRGRLTELTLNPPALLSQRMLRATGEVLRARLGDDGPGPTLRLEDARRDLLCGLRDALQQFLHVDGSLPQLLEQLGHRERHWRHRAYWALARPGQFKTALNVDPSITLWQDATAALQGSSTPTKAGKLVDAWRSCPSILRHHDPAYSLIGARLRPLAVDHPASSRPPPR